MSAPATVHHTSLAARLVQSTARFGSIRALSVMVFVAALFLYLSQLSPDVAGEDAGEFQFTPYVLGIPHPTGYPLYVLFGKLWVSVVPFGSIAYRMNFLSAVSAALAVALIFVLVYRLTHRSGAGLIAAVALGSNSWFWEYALVASVRTMHEMLIAAMLLMAVIWAARPIGQRDRWLHGLALCTGIALAHHRTTVFMLPGLMIFVIVLEPALLRNGTGLLRLALLTFTPLLSYLYILVRGLMGAPFAQVGVEDVASWWVVVTGSNLTGGRFVFELGSFWAQLRDVLTTLGQAYSFLGLALAAIGLLTLLWQKPIAFVLIGMGLALTLLMLCGLVSGTGLQKGFYMNLYLLVAIAIGIGAGGLANFVAAVAPHGARAALPTGVMTVVMALIVWLISRNGFEAVQALNSATLKPTRIKLPGVQATRLVEGCLPRMAPDAMVLGDWDQITPFWYYQYVNQQRPDVRFYYSVYPWREIGAEEHRFNRPLYLTRKVPEMQGQKHLSMCGPVVQWSGVAQTHMSADVETSNAQFGDQLALAGFRQRLLRPNGWFGARPHIMQLSLVWRALQTPARNYSISLRLFNADDKLVAQEDSAHPVMGLFPTSLWEPGEVVEDYYELRTPPDDTSDTYHVKITLYWRDAAGAFHNLKLAEDGGEPFALPPLTAR